MPVQREAEDGDAGDGWWLVVPVKPLARAKSRLGLPGPARARLALAFAVDTVTAALRARAVAGVLVVTDDPRAARALTERGALVVGDEPDSGLNPALAHGAALLTRSRPGHGVAALSADLPALRPDQLDATLREAEAASRSYLPDAAGVGTTLLAARRTAPLEPRFGADSRLAHAASGAVELPLRGVDSLRRDVDTRADLREAIRLGVGPATTAVLTELGTPERWAAEPIQ
jgi:2-phospho-L-lactate guanylyltransferase